MKVFFLEISFNSQVFLFRFFTVKVCGLGVKTHVQSLYFLALSRHLKFKIAYRSLKFPILKEFEEYKLKIAPRPFNFSVSRQFEEYRLKYESVCLIGSGTFGSVYYIR